MTEQATDEPETAEDETDSERSPTPHRGQRQRQTAEDRKDKLIGYLEIGALAALALLGLVALFGAYSSALSAIDTWIAREYQSIFETVFNLVVLGLVGVGISVLVRRRFED